MFLNNQQETSTVVKLRRLFLPTLPHGGGLKPLDLHLAYLANCPEGSSETTREATYKDVYDPIFLDWRIGFTEGDGGFHLSATDKRCFFVIQQAEPEVLYKIKDARKMGSVTHSEPDVWRYAVSAKGDIFKRIHIFNGNRILHKRREQFKRWVENWNKHMRKNLRLHSDFPTVDLKTRDRKFSLHTAWFSGFVDAEGCFNLTVTKNQRYAAGYRARLRFKVDQSDALDFWPQYEEVMGSGTRTLLKVSRCHNWTINDLKVIASLVFPYFAKFPLRSRKRISLLRFYKCHAYMTAKKHRTPQGMQQVLRWKRRSKGSLDYKPKDSKKKVLDLI